MSNQMSMNLNQYKELCQATKETNEAIMRGMVDKLVFLRSPEKFLSYLSTSDFYYAPASTIYHDNFVGGLFSHSLRVFKALAGINKMLESREKYTAETCFYVAFGHDVCKIDFYQSKERFRKDKNDRWEKYLGYEVVDKFPFGHGEKSALIMSKYVDLKQDELLAIRWHMGAFDGAVRETTGSYAYSNAQSQSPLVAMLHTADLLSTYIYK